MQFDVFKTQTEPINTVKDSFVFICCIYVNLSGKSSSPLLISKALPCIMS